MNMPSANKKNKKHAVKAEPDSPEKKLTKSPAKMAVVSQQLEKAMENKKKVKQLQKRGKRDRGVLYIKNLPHGFFEEQIQKYFAQFGAVTRVRLCRSLRTGRSRGYAFVEFAVPEVAEVAAETMNNYLMFRKIIKAAYIPPDQVKYNYFKSSVRKVTNKFGKETFMSAKTKEIRKKMNELNNWSDENYKKRLKRSEKKLRALKRRLGDDAAEFIDSCVVRPLEPVEVIDEKDNAATDLPAAKKRKANKKSTSEEQSSDDSSAAEKTTSSAAKNTSSDIAKKQVSSESETTLASTPVKPKKKKQKGKKQSDTNTTSEAEKSSSSTAAKPSQKKQKASVQPTTATTSDTSSSSAANPPKSNRKGTQVEKTSTNGIPKDIKKQDKKVTAETTLSRLLEDTIEDDSSSDEDFHPDDIDSDDIPDDIYEESSDDDATDDKDKPNVANDTSSSSDAKSAKTKPKAKQPKKDFAQELDKAIKMQKKIVEQVGKGKGKATTKEMTLGNLLEDTIEDNSSSDDDFQPEGSDSEDIPGDKYGSSDDDIPPDTYELTEESDSESEEADSDSDNPTVALNKKTTKQKPIGIPQKGKHKMLQAQTDTTEDDDSSDEELEFEDDTSSMSEDSSEDEESSPAKPVKYPTKPGQQNKHMKVIQKKPLDGGIRKKSKDIKPAKSQALQQKIKEVAKEITKQKEVVSVKPKDIIKDKKAVPQLKTKQVGAHKKPAHSNAKDIKKKGKKRGY